MLQPPNPNPQNQQFQPSPQWQQPPMPSPSPPPSETYEVPQTPFPSTQPELKPAQSRSKRPWITVCFLLILALCLIIGMFVVLGHVSSSPSSPSSGSSTYTFSGNGVQQTDTISLSSDWTLEWTCDPSSFVFGSYNVQVFVYNSDGSLAGVAVNTICSSNNTSGSTVIHQGGSMYLEINSEAAWTLTVTG